MPVQVGVDTNSVTMEQRPKQAGEEAPQAPMAWSHPDFGAVYEEHSQCVFYLALRLMGDSAQAQDATHDVFLKAFRKIGEFQGKSGLRTWLYRITLNHCQNLRQSWHQRHMFSNAEEVVWETASGLEENPFQALETKELGQRIQAALDGLPPEYRTLILLVADDKLSYEEVGELTGQSADAVRGKLHRARKAFAQRFAKSA